MSTQHPLIVHLLCGLPGSGKTTLAQRLAKTRPAVRFTLDEWMLTLYDYTIDMPEYGHAVTRCQELIWRTGLHVLAVGQEIILDWSLWSRERRRIWRERITDAGFAHQLYYLNVPLAQIEERLARRNAQRLAGTHHIDVAEVRRFASFFEAPTAAEGLNLVEMMERGEK